MEWIAKVLFCALISILLLRVSAVDENEAELFIAAETAVWRMNIDGSQKTLFARAQNATSLDFHHAKRLVFWSDVEAHKIYSKDLFDESAEVKTVVDGGLDWEPRAIAVDHVHDKIYVIDQAGKKIDVFELDGSKMVEGLVGNITEPDQGNWTDKLGPSTLDIAVDPYRGLVFYGDYNRVYRATMDFSSIKFIGRKSFVSGITVDPRVEKYYLNSVDRLLWETRYDGVHTDIVNARDHPTDYLRGAFISPRSLSKYNRNFYYIDWRQNEYPGVWKLQYYNEKSVNQGVTNAWTVRVRHPSLQSKPEGIDVENACENQRCQYMCLVSNKKYSPFNYSCFDREGNRINPTNSNEIL